MPLFERRRPADVMPTGCGLCHEASGLLDTLVIDGTGLRQLHFDCRLRLEAMGYTIHPERRSAA